ncbi:hypothetical protein ANCDUO_06950 [Ancylostoma duodenale]|uniref:Uncharacterized protein n=1 Tax=Ancylostoma duodenale TaxID=51022 RepID=A0A0C2DJU1_9BILA|nr:hypothetical protein ANCDUO_06950 [Ancylostoma duodenale]
MVTETYGGRRMQHRKKCMWCGKRGSQLCRTNGGDTLAARQRFRCRCISSSRLQQLTQLQRSSCPSPGCGC